MKIWSKNLTNLEKQKPFLENLIASEFNGEIKKKGDFVWFCPESLIPKEILDKLELVENEQ